MSPAEYVIKVFGGVRETARILNRSPSAVCRWNKFRGTGVTYGMIPIKMRREILEIAKRKGLPITSEHLDFGAPSSAVKKNVNTA